MKRLGGGKCKSAKKGCRHSVCRPAAVRTFLSEPDKASFVIMLLQTIRGDMKYELMDRLYEVATSVGRTL